MATKKAKFKTRSTSQVKRVAAQEADSAYFLKLVLFIVLGAQWLRIYPANGSQIPVPLGLLIGLLFAAHDHFQIDRKIEYAMLLIMAMVAFWLPIGLELHL